MAENHQMAFENATPEADCPGKTQQRTGNERVHGEEDAAKSKASETSSLAGKRPITASIRDSSRYSCPRCGNAYTRPHSLSRHMRFECGVEPQFECPVCHKKSKHKHNLVLHMRTHQKH
nr:PREDICTED: zinc finger protein 391-like [Megachile rotundata]